jgi:hypothetical protein
MCPAGLFGLVGLQDLPDLRWGDVLGVAPGTGDVAAGTLAQEVVVALSDAQLDSLQAGDASVAGLDGLLQRLQNVRRDGKVLLLRPDHELATIVALDGSLELLLVLVVVALNRTALPLDVLEAGTVLDIDHLNGRCAAGLEAVGGIQGDHDVGTDGEDEGREASENQPDGVAAVVVVFGPHAAPPSVVETTGDKLPNLVVLQRPDHGNGEE